MSLQPIIEQDEMESYEELVAQHRLLPALQFLHAGAQLQLSAPLSASRTAWLGTIGQMKVGRPSVSRRSVWPLQLPAPHSHAAPSRSARAGAGIGAGIHPSPRFTAKRIAHARRRSRPRSSTT
jgi:hypothetical protein